MEESPPAPDTSLTPIETQEEPGVEIDDIIPSHGYGLCRVVALGGSAGAIPALQQFLHAMPERSGMAFVVVLHLSPEHESVLSQVLQRSSRMPITQAVHGERVEPDHVYVIPPGKWLSLTDGHLRLSDLPREPGQRMTVDRFFRSLADTHGPHSVAIVLSGVDGDGAIGIKRIKERGGLTIAQDPDDAEQPGMPRAAIATGMVDWVLRAAEIPPRLADYQQREDRLKVELPSEGGPNPSAAPRPALSGEETALRDVLTFLRTRTGRDFSYYKRATIVRRLARRMQVNEVDDLRGYLNFLRTHPGEATALLQDLLISVTNFFRDPDAFAALESIIPDLFRHKGPNDSVRVWVPACATGEEAYSIGMLLAEHARTLDAPPTLQIFATDLDEGVLTTARSAVYPETISTDVSPDRLRRFFVKQHQGYRVRRELRETLLFAVHDLLKDSPFSRVDLISCRNLLIYLNRDAQDRAFDIFHFALRPEGRLFLGTSETADDGSQLFYPLDKKHRLYASKPITRTSLPVPSGPSTLARALALRETVESGSGSATNFLPSPGLVTLGEQAHPRDRIPSSEVHLKLIERFGPPSLIVNAEHDILHLSEGASRFLRVGGGEATTNLLRLVEPTLRVELRAALFRAHQSAEPAGASSVPITIDGQRRLVDIQVSPAPELAPGILMVTFGLQPPMADSADPSKEAEPIVHHLEEELELTKRHLRDTVEQHEASTEELKASNEELQAMNEELRSATEELETSREELQSINEELTTVNIELKTKVDELAHTNSDLHNLMGATAIATVFLDRDLRIMRFTPPALELFSLIPTDVGRPLGDLQHRLIYPELMSDASRVLQQLVPVEREVAERQGRTYLARLLPYRTTDDRIAGVVLTFVDISDQQSAREAVNRAHQQLEQRVRERTAELDAVNVELRREVSSHEQAQISRQFLQRRLIDAQEAERARISRELHDEVGQQVAAFLLTLKMLEQKVPVETRELLKELRLTAEQIGQEVHQLATELRPPALDDLGLTRALASYLELRQAITGIGFDLVTSGLTDARLPGVIETTVYRIVQEAVNNVCRHAEAQHVSVIVERGTKVLVIVEDDGKGFDLPAFERDNGLEHIGIAGMRERAAIAGGVLSIESTPGAGTTVRVELPLSGR